MKYSKIKKNVREIIVSKIMSDHAIAQKAGHYFDESDFKKIINYDCDVYYYEDGDKKLLLKFRKGVFSKKQCSIAVQSLRKVAQTTKDNRGAAGGIIDVKKLPQYVYGVNNSKHFRTSFFRKDGSKSKTATSNLAPSNIVGYYDKPDRNLLGHGAKCRMTAFNRDHVKKWKAILPFVTEINHAFKELVPNRYKLQYNLAKQTPKFQIGNTAFSTMTVNYSWRTALHKDAGDLEEGFGNLIVCEDSENKNQFSGCYLGFPQFGIAVNVREGDFLAMDVHQWHCNTEYKPTTKYHSLDKKSTFKSKLVKRNKWYFNRLSIVLYYRKNMIQCKHSKNRKDKNPHQTKKETLSIQNGGQEYINKNIYTFNNFTIIDDL